MRLRHDFEVGLGKPLAAVRFPDADGLELTPHELLFATMAALRPATGRRRSRGRRSWARHIAPQPMPICIVTTNTVPAPDAMSIELTIFSL